MTGSTANTTPSNVHSLPIRRLAPSATPGQRATLRPLADQLARMTDHALDLSLYALLDEYRRRGRQAVALECSHELALESMTSEELAGVERLLLARGDQAVAEAVDMGGAA